MDSKVIVACQVCKQDVDLGSRADKKKASNNPSSPNNGEQSDHHTAESIYLQECCFSIVCKDCLRLETEPPKPPGSSVLTEAKTDEVS